MFNKSSLLVRRNPLHKILCSYRTSIQRATSNYSEQVELEIIRMKGYRFYFIISTSSVFHFDITLANKHNAFVLGFPAS